LKTQRDGSYQSIVTYYSIVLYESNMTVIKYLHTTQSWDFYVPTHYTITVGNNFLFIPQCTGTTWWVGNSFDLHVWNYFRFVPQHIFALESITVEYIYT